MPPQEGIDAFKAALTSGAITPAEARKVLEEQSPAVGQEQAATGAALRTVAGAAPAQEPSEPETAPRSFLVFPATAERLRPHLNLVQEAGTFARSLVRWGAMSSGQEDAYCKWLQANAVLDEADLQELLQRLQAGELWTPDFPLQTDEPDADLFQRLLPDAGINMKQWTPLDTFRETDQGGRSVEHAQTPKKPRLTFSPNTTKVPDEFRGTKSERTADFWRTQRRAEDMLRPTQWLTRFLASVDVGLHALNPETDLNALAPDAYRRLRTETLQNPDSGIDPYLLDGLETVTQFPYDRTAGDGVLGLRWDPRRGLRWVRVDGWGPAFAGGGMGPRPALG